MTDYLAIARRKISRPKPKLPSMVIYGRNKKGKTRLCASAPDVLILDPEGGTSAETVDVWPIEHWEDLNEALQALKSGVKGTTGKPYQWVALDGCTRFASMALTFFQGKSDPKGSIGSKPAQRRIQDFGGAGELFKSMVLNFLTLPMGVIFTAQERMVEPQQSPQGLPEEDSDGLSCFLVPDLPRGCRSTLNAAVDLIGRVYTTTEEKTKRVKVNGKIEIREYREIQRRLWIAPHEAYDTGYRTDLPNLPDYLTNTTVPLIVSTIRRSSTNGSNQ